MTKLFICQQTIRVAAGVLRAVEPSILPGGIGVGCPYRAGNLTPSAGGKMPCMCLSMVRRAGEGARRLRRFRIAQPFDVPEFPERQESADGEAA